MPRVGSWCSSAQRHPCNPGCPAGGGVAANTAVGPSARVACDRCRLRACRRSYISAAGPVGAAAAANMAVETSTRVNFGPRRFRACRRSYMNHRASRLRCRSCGSCEHGGRDFDACHLRSPPLSRLPALLHWRSGLVRRTRLSAPGPTPRRPSPRAASRTGSPASRRIRGCAGRCAAPRFPHPRRRRPCSGRGRATGWPR